MPELSIGGDSTASPDRSFVSILDMQIARDGRLWVLDDQRGSNPDGPSRLRVYGSRGEFVREVGRAGDGPGEFRKPAGIAELPDGRIALRDMSPPPRVTLYDPDGRFLRQWRLPSDGYAVIGGRSVIDVDAAGMLWMLVTGRPARTGRNVSYLRFTPDGAFLGSAPAPAYTGPSRPDMELIKHLPNGGIRRVGWSLPFQPMQRWAFGPDGVFATSDSTEYRVTFLPIDLAEASRDATQPALITRNAIPQPISCRVRPVSVPDSEREDRRVALRALVATYPGGAELRIPEIVSTKPPLRDVGYSGDGRLLLMVSTASVQHNGRWHEPEVYDLFDRGGRLEGRMSFPPDFHLVQLRADRACGVARDADDVESVRCYRMVLPV